MTYQIVFTNLAGSTDYYVRVNRPMSFKTFIERYLFDHTMLSFENGTNKFTGEINGIYQMGVDYPAQYELTMDGYLLLIPEVTHVG